MAKSMYVGVDNLAKKVKSAYVGVDGVARKVKKAYVGIGGLARPFYSADLLSYYGEIEGFYSKKAHSAYGTVGNYLLYVGGEDTYITDVDAYSTSLVHTTPTSLSEVVANSAYASVGNYALFAGGQKSSSSITSKVHAYNTSLTYSNPTTLSSSKTYLAGASVGNYALFAGGQNSSGSSVYSTVYTYNTSLTRSTATALTKARTYLAGASVGNYALFAGGCNANLDNFDTVDAYSTSLVRTTPTSLVYTDRAMASASVGNYVLFSHSFHKYISIYSSTLVRTSIRTVRSLYNGASLNKYAVFSSYSTSPYTFYYHLYDSTLLINIQQSPHIVSSATGFNKANCMFATYSSRVHVYKEN